MSTIIKAGPDFGWAAVWPDGKPYPFIIVHTVSDRAADARKTIGMSWQHDGEDWKKGWRRAYRNGCRVTRVKVTIWGGHGSD